MHILVRQMQLVVVHIECPEHTLRERRAEPYADPVLFENQLNCYQEACSEYLDRFEALGVLRTITSNADPDVTCRRLRGLLRGLSLMPLSERTIGIIPKVAIGYKAANGDNQLVYNFVSDGFTVVGCFEDSLSVSDARLVLKESGGFGATSLNRRSSDPISIPCFVVLLEREDPLVAQAVVPESGAVEERPRAQ